MLQLPETPATASRKSRRPAEPGVAVPPHQEDAAAHQRLRDLEEHISNAKVMASVLSIIANKLASEVRGYRNAPSHYTAIEMSKELDEATERVLFLAYEVEEMLRFLNVLYFEPLDPLPSGPVEDK